jgi:hypothetical protein
MLMTPSRKFYISIFFALQKPIMSLVKVFRQRELQGTLRITNEFNDYVQNQIEKWCIFFFFFYIENDISI